MKRKKILYLSLLALIIAAAVIYYFLPKKEQPLMLVTEQPVYGHIAEMVTSTGTIQPVDTVAVGTQVSGVISEIYTDFNGHVKQGQLLAKLDPTLMQGTVDQLNGNLTQAKSNFTYQAANFERQKKLFEVGAISRAEYDLAVNSYEAAKASISSINGQLLSARKNLELTKIYSPINGVVLSRNVSVGQTVAASFNTPTLFTIAKDITKMQVLAKVDEADIGDIKPGERVTFTVDAYLNDLFSGIVSDVRLQPTTSSNVVTYTTVINAGNDSLKLMPGMTATISIYTKEADKALLLPVKALKFTPDTLLLGKHYIVEAAAGGAPQHKGSFVWVREGDRLVQKRIVTGINNDSQVQVLEGITENDKVVTGIIEGNAIPGQQGGQGGSPFLPKFRRR